jgi:hypothetical protein
MTDAQVAGGHKATINNPNTSEEAKENSRQVLENEFNGGDGRLHASHYKSYFDTLQSLALRTIRRRALVMLLVVSRRKFQRLLDLTTD